LCGHLTPYIDVSESLERNLGALIGYVGNTS